MKLLKATRLEGTLTVPADKSISHRSIMFGAIASGETKIYNFLRSDDCMSTLYAFRDMGVTIIENENEITVYGVGLSGLKKPEKALNLGNSGTTMRLLLGLLSAQPFDTIVYGDKYLNKRPMNRVMNPLSQMGGTFIGSHNNEYAPISIKGNPVLNPITYRMPIASAQVKSAILLAALQTEGTTQIIEKDISRNHTEQMIRQFGGKIEVHGKNITITGPQHLKGQEIKIPGDISSAAFFIVAALIVPNSKITLRNVGINPTRTGILDIVEQMGGSIECIDVDTINESATLIVTNSDLNSCIIEGEIIPRLIDELPIIALLATQAEGTTVIKNAEELKVKETNRIDATAEELNQLGADITKTSDGLIINGPTPLHGGQVSSRGDHRIGMMLQIAALLTQEDVELSQPEAVSVSYPNFFESVKTLIQ